MSYPQFTIEADGTVLKPVYKAIDRFTSRYLMEVGIDTLRIQGVGSANVAGIDITIPSSAFDTYEIETPGSFMLRSNREPFSKARKSDRTRITVGEPGHEIKLYRGGLPALDNDAKEVLRDKNLYGVDALKQASVEDLVGEVEPEIGVGDPEAVLEQEQAEAILWEVNAPAVKMEANDGDETVSARMVHPISATTFPETAWVTSATMNAADFEAPIKAAKAMAEHVRVAFLDGEFFLFTKADTDELHATPQVSDYKASDDEVFMYSVDYLRDLSRVIDRPASTDLTLEIHAGEKGSGLLIGEYKIGSGDATADARVMVAPRIYSEDEDQEDEEELIERIRPGKYDPFPEPRLKAVMDGLDAKTWFYQLNADVDECRLTFDADGIHTIFVDPANVMMQKMDLESSAFKKYEARRNAGLLYQNDGVVGFPTHRITDYISRSKKGETVTLYINADAQIGIETDEYTITAAPIDPDSVRKPPTLPDLDYTAHATVNGNDLYDAVKELDDLVDHAAWIINDGTLYLAGEDYGEELSVEVPTSEGAGYAASMFSNKYLKDYLKAPRKGGRDEDYEIVMGTTRPLHVRHTVRDEAAEFRMLIAPRVVSDSDGPGAQAYKDELNIDGFDPGVIDAAPERFRLNEDGTITAFDVETSDLEPEEDTEDDDGDGNLEIGDYGPTMDTPIPEAVQMQTDPRLEALRDEPDGHDYDEREPPETIEDELEAAGLDALPYDPTHEEIEANIEAAEKAGVFTPMSVGARVRIEGEGIGTVTSVAAAGHYVQLDGENEARRYDVDDLTPGGDDEYEAFGEGQEPLLSEEDPEEFADRLNVEGWDHRVTEDGADSWKSEYPAPGYPESENSLVMVEPDEDDYAVIVYPFDGDGQPFGDPIQEQKIIETYQERETARLNAAALARQIHDQAGEGDQETDEPIPAITEADEPYGENTPSAYDPTTEFEDDDPPTPKHFGDYRREKVERLEATPHLAPIEAFDSLEDMAEAIEDIHVPDYSSPPEDTIEKLRHYFGRLPDEEAERYYLNDYKLTRTINAARRAFNEWVGRKKRFDQMPG